MNKIIDKYFLSDDRNKHLDELIKHIHDNFGMKNVSSIHIQIPFKSYELCKDKVKWCDFGGIDLKYKFGSIPNYSNLHVITCNEYKDEKIFVLLKSLDDPISIVI